ncbi:hypothetical protein VMCG_04124 [Cytospora schulzeri]|uniref:Uncharacterized protein n=1 Tax=Cytospora schulzeri TaxID=448051 RepID=A0A423WUA4_9PEZI|nr:hypothetical protein VMCG_04124 [Valsa malicola]
MQERQEENPSMPQGQSTAATGQYPGGFVSNGQNIWGGYNNGINHAFTGSFDAQSTVNSPFNNAYYANGTGGAFPFSASPHASVPSAATTSFGTNNTTNTADNTITNASQQTISPFPDGLPSATASPGPLLAATAFNAPLPSPSPFVQSHAGPADLQRNITPSSAVRPPSANYDPPATSNSPRPVMGERRPLPSQRQQFQDSTKVPSRGTATGGTATSQAEARPAASTHNAGVEDEENRPELSPYLSCIVYANSDDSFVTSETQLGFPIREIRSWVSEYCQKPISNNEESLNGSKTRPIEIPSESKSVLGQARGGSDADGGSDLTLKKPEDTSVQTDEDPDSESDQDSDDEIKYETAGKTTGVADVLNLDEDAGADNTSEDDTESASDDDEAVEAQKPTPNGDAYSSFRQLFLPPDESDNEEDEGTDNDDATSVSSSTQSALDAEPTAALPSANIQHQIDYPPNILEMATPTRAYVSWSDETISFQKSHGALFPDGYKKCTEIPDHPWICAVRSCRLTYKTNLGLFNHFKFTHKKAMFNDNMDGTLSLVGSYTLRNESGMSPPVVVSKRPLDPKEPPMLEPSIPIKKQRRETHASISPKDASSATSPTGENMVTTDLKPVSSSLPQNPSPPANADPGSSEKMWEYIRPFLKVHDSIPTINWVRHVIHLPRVRDIKWNEKRNKEYPYRDSHPRDITALVVFATGVEAPRPCAYCAEGKGPFIGCIMISPNASEEARHAVLACANCYYHCGQSQCTHNNDALSRRDRGSRESQQTRNYNLKLLSDKAAGRVAATTSAQQRDGMAKPPTPTLSGVAPSRSLMRLFDPSEINNIDMASESRTYKVIHGKDGEMIQMHGALIPEHYDLDRSVPGYPWICPVRSCRLVHKRIAGLGSHFIAKHRGCLFNDNLDGTLSQVGIYNKPVSGNTCPALIISKEPLDKTESPMEQARVLNDKTAKPAKIAKPPKPTPLAITQPKVNSNAKRLWDFILPYLPQPLTTLDDPLVHKIFEHPRVRPIKWRKTWLKRTLDDDWRQVAGLLIHLVGVEYEGPVVSCTFCRRGEGPFEGCQVLPPEVSYESAKLIKSCANCFFIHRRDHCSTKSSWEKRCGSQADAAPLSAPPIDSWAAATATSSFPNTVNGTGSNNKRPYVEESDDEREEPRLSRRRSERMRVRIPEVEAKSEPARKLVTFPLLSKDKQPAATGALRKGNTVAESSSSMSALISSGQTTPDGLLEMEEWEIAPGRIRETGVMEPNNIAFSKAYLEAQQMVRVSPELSFRVETVKSGRTLDFEADQARTRYCSLASGKLRVTLDGQPEFTIGTHGLFKIKPGVKGRVQNRLYIDSVLHINAVEGDC